MKTQHNDRIVEEAAALAAAWQNRANELLTAEEKGVAQQMKRLMTHPMDKVVLTKLIDQSFRSENTARIADQVNYLLAKFGVPDFFSSVEKVLVQMFMGLGRYIPSVAVPKMIEKMRHDSSRAIIPGEPDVLHALLHKRKEQGIRMNINRLGEAILGEEEALHRLKSYINDLENPDIEYISVKVSTIYSQIQSLAFEHTVRILTERLTQLYHAAGNNYFVRSDDTKVPKFVNLDMEEYRDLQITAAAFTRTLEQAELKHHSAGIVLQAYLPDSYEMQKELTTWAQARLKKGGSPIKIRIVKGANMEMELQEAAVHNWPQAPYDNKLDVMPISSGWLNSAWHRKTSERFTWGSDPTTFLNWPTPASWPGSIRSLTMFRLKCSKGWPITCAGPFTKYREMLSYTLRLLSRISLSLPLVI